MINDLERFESVQSNLFVKVAFGEVYVPLYAEKTAVLNGNSAINKETFRFGSGSISVSANGDNVSVEPSSEFTWGTETPFTYEGWYRFNTIPSAAVLFDTRGGSGVFVPNVRYVLGSFQIGYGDGIVAQDTYTLEVDTWYHIALVRVLGSNYLFVNGTLVTEVHGQSFNYQSVGDTVLGSDYTWTNAIDGYIDEFRVSASARYVAEFTPPSSAFICDSDTRLLLHFDTDLKDDNLGLAPSEDDLFFSDRLYPTVIDGNTYVGLGRLMGITDTTSEIKASSSDLTITISGIPNTSLQEILNLKLKGAKIFVYRVLFNPETNQMLEIAGNPLARYRGFINNYSLQEDYAIETRTATNTLVMVCASAIDVLGNKYSGRKTNPISEKKFFPDDLSMDRVPTLENATFNFGAPL